MTNRRRLIGASAVALLPVLAACFTGSSGTPGPSADFDAGEQDTSFDVTIPLDSTTPEEAGRDATVDGAPDASPPSADAAVDATGEAAMDSSVVVEAEAGSVLDASGPDAPTEAAPEAGGCGSGLVPCDGGCIPVSADDSNCGGCGVACGAGQTCVAAGCVTPVAPEAGTVCDPNVRAGFPVVVAPDGVYLIEGIPSDQPTPLSTTTWVAFAADGGLDLSSCATTTGSVPVAEYGMGLAQASSSVHLLAGANSVGTLANVFTAQIADGGLTPFVAPTVEGDAGTTVAMQVSRYGAVVAQTTSYVYVIGGYSAASWSSGQDLAQIERAQIDPLTGAFVTSFAPAIDPATSQPATLAMPRLNATMYQQGSWVYVLGGQTGVGANSVLHGEIQRASLDVSGNLSSFVQVGTLPTNLAGASAYVAGGSLYLLGGATDFVNPNYVTTNSVLQASIAADGSLGPFTTTSLTLAYPVVADGFAVLGQTAYLFEGITAFNAMGTFESFTVP